MGKAAKRGRIQVAMMLVDQGVDLNKQNTGGATPLMLSVMHRSCDRITDALIEYKANIDIQKDVGYTALMLACRVGNAHATRALIEAKANIEIEDHQGETALAKAVKYKKLEVTALLEQHGARRPTTLNYHHKHHTFALRYLVTFSKAAPLCSTVELGLGP